MASKLGGEPSRLSHRALDPHFVEESIAKGCHEREQADKDDKEQRELERRSAAIPDVVHVACPA